MPIFFTKFDENYSVDEKLVLSRVGVLKYLFIIFTADNDSFKTDVYITGTIETPLRFSSRCL
jgi:hypothetical protein